MPYGLLDPRLIKFAMIFWQDPDAALQKAHRAFEEIVRRRTSLKSHGAKLFAEAFNVNKEVLGWPELDKGEQEGRASYIISVCKAFRNPRAHRNLGDDVRVALRELLSLNEAYKFEQDAVNIHPQQPNNS